MPLLRDLPDLIDGARPGLLDREMLASRFQYDLERYLSYLAIDQPYLREADNLRNRARFLDASQTIADALLDVQNEVLSAAMPTWLGELVTAWHDQRATVVTLNYDHLIEKASGTALQASQRFDRVLQGEDLWAVPVTNVLLRRAGMWGGPQPDTFRLLKLHGSLGWRYSGSATFYGETIYHARLGGGWHADDPLEIRRAASDKVALIVPPTAGKSAFFNNETVRAQWTMAADAVRYADVVTIIGYSMPPTDELVSGVLGLASTRASITVVDRSADVAGRVEAVVSCGVTAFEARSPVTSSRSTCRRCRGDTVSIAQLPQQRLASASGGARECERGVSGRRTDNGRQSARWRRRRSASTMHEAAGYRTYPETTPSSAASNCPRSPVRCCAGPDGPRSGSHSDL